MLYDCSRPGAFRATGSIPIACATCRQPLYVCRAPKC